MALAELTVSNTMPFDKPVKLTDGNGMQLTLMPSARLSKLRFAHQS